MECPNELGIYDLMVPMEFPDHMLSENGGYYITKTKCDVDPCLVEEIKYLWSKGVHTMGCCCGHGKTQGYIQVLSENDADKMLSLGYELLSKELLSFKAKSAHEG